MPNRDSSGGRRTPRARESVSVRDAAAANVRGERNRLRLSQEDLAGRMQSIGFDTWSRTAVAEIEATRRSVTAEELLGLALVLGVPVGALLDPGRRDLDFAFGRTAPMPSATARAWVRGVAVAELFPESPDNGTIDYTPASLPDYREGVRAALDEMTWKLAARRAEPRLRFAGLRGGSDVELVL